MHSLPPQLAFVLIVGAKRRLQRFSTGQSVPRTQARAAGIGAPTQTSRKVKRK